jgi:hypothetical protein
MTQPSLSVVYFNGPKYPYSIERRPNPLSRPFLEARIRPSLSAGALARRVAAAHGVMEMDGATADGGPGTTQRAVQPPRLRTGAAADERVAVECSQG